MGFADKLQVRWNEDRYKDICGQLRTFLVQTGFHPSKTKFVPVAASLGVNLVSLKGSDAEELRRWYKGPTLVNMLGMRFLISCNR